MISTSAARSGISSSKSEILPLEPIAHQRDPLKVGHQRARNAHRVAHGLPPHQSSHPNGNLHLCRGLRIDRRKDGGDIRPQLGTCAQHERQRGRSDGGNHADRPVAILLAQIGFQNLLVARAAGTNEIQILRINGDSLGAAGVQGRTESRGDTLRKGKTRVILVEVQHRARQGFPRERGRRRETHHQQNG